jgi:competence ComEA-like helix-hairpin-helix protein
VRAFQLIRGQAIDYPIRVVRDNTEARALKHTADSLMAIRVAQINAPININTADAAQFESLDGIGKVLAARIVEYRKEHGPFRSVDELDNVSGIGPKRLNMMRNRCFANSLNLVAIDSAR